MSFVEELAKAQIATQVIGGDGTLSEIQNAVYLRQDAKILDVGSGGGDFAVRLSATFRTAVTSIDASPEMTKLSERRLAKIAAVAHVDFLCADVMNPLPESQYDLVAHRGIEVFFDNIDPISKRLSSLVKPLGYLVSVLQTYESPPSADLIQRINSATGYRIKPMAKADYVALYEREGLSLVKSVSLALKPATFDASLPSALRDALEVCNENDGATQAFLLIFRKSDSHAMLGASVMYAKA